jgi:hypothetical protein
MLGTAGTARCRRRSPVAQAQHKDISITRAQAPPFRAPLLPEQRVADFRYVLVKLHQYDGCNCTQLICSYKQHVCSSIVAQQRTMPSPTSGNYMPAAAIH